MCYIDFYEKTKIHNPMIISGALLIITSIFMIAIGTARAREDVWVAGILVAIVGCPIFLFGVFMFCYLNRPGRPPKYEQDFSVSKLSVPATANVQSISRPFYPIKGYDMDSRVYRSIYGQPSRLHNTQQYQIQSGN